jgi:phosphoglycolate phosphatase-like HAD superfamily hydrolase
MIKTIVFDWNGTLLADTHACWETDNHVLKFFGGKQVNLKTYKDTIIIPSINFYAMHGCNRQRLEIESKKLGEVFHAYYEPRVSKIRTRINTRRLLDFLLKNKIESVILSNHTIIGITSQLKRLKIEKYFSKILANDALNQSMKGRNKKEKLEEFLQNNNFKKDEVMIVGDSPEEVEIGKHCGIKTVAISGGYYATHRLIASQPDYLINNLIELIDLL